MGEFLARLKAVKESLSVAERKIVQYIIDHPDEVPFRSVSELAECGGVSVATVSRLPRKLGLKNLHDLRITVARDTPSAPIDSIYEGVSREDSDETVVGKVFAGNLSSIRDTLSMLDTGDLIRCAKKANEASRLMFIGIGGSGYLALDAALRFSHLGYHADAYTDAYQIITRTLNVGADEIVVGISHSGRSAAPVAGMEQAKKRGAFTVGISNYLHSPLHHASDIFICTSFPETKVRAAALSSRVSQMCLLDAFYLLTARHRKASSSAARANAAVEALLRLPRKGGDTRP